MKFTVNIIPEDNPEMIGEILRGEFFDQSKGLRGCYSTFEIMPDVMPLQDEPTDDFDINYKVFSKIIDNQLVIMKYYWDGDGTLEFHFEDGSFVSNDDCKSEYDWVYYPQSNSKIDWRSGYGYTK